MTVSELIETLERLKEHDPEVEMACDTEATWVCRGIGDVVLFDGTITIYGDVDGDEE